MKKYFIFLLPVLAIACSDPKPPSTEQEEIVEEVEMERNSWTNWHLKGEVKTITETPYLTDEAGAMGMMDSCCVEITEFDPMGFRSKVTEKNSEGKVTGENVVVHSETGKFVSSTWTRDGKQVWQRTVTRDEDGKVTSAFDTDSTMQITNFYDTDEMNEFNQPVSGKSYAADSTFVGTWSWKYIDGLRSGRGWIDSTGVQLIDRTGEVNEMGWLSKVVDTRMDDNGEMVTTVETYTYDSFDEAGNWTKCTLSENNEPVKIMTRTYTYY